MSPALDPEIPTPAQVIVSVLTGTYCLVDRANGIYATAENGSTGDGGGIVQVLADGPGAGLEWTVVSL
ncbi:hypothetical protein [Streptomyces sp. NPDC056361]|uniref:hypothetical protein n=1 Tax=Streptomyces sp. NPDC056361 TaxID=3345795 RepID=UPI0035D7D7A7